MDTTLSAIGAIDAHGAIGRNGQLLCHLPADLKHFKAITTGHSIIMGRKTFESFPRGPLPGRQNIVVTRNAHYRPQGVTVAHSIDQAIALVEMPGEAFIIGGGTLYQATIGLVSTLHLTRIEAAFAEADTFFPHIDAAQWAVASEEHHEADERNPYPYTFVTLCRK